VGDAAGQAGEGVGQDAGQAAQAVAPDTQEAAQKAQGADQGSDGKDPPDGKKQKNAPLTEARSLLKQAEDSHAATQGD
jgi:hypothetical protein